MLRQVTAASALAVSLATTKSHLQVNWDDDDDLITAYIQAATELVEKESGTCLAVQVWKEYFPAFPAYFELQKRPVKTLTSITYLDSAEATVTLDASTYRVSTSPKYLPTMIYPKTIWPSAYSTYFNPEFVTVTYTAGYDAPPALACQAVLLLCSHWYSNRDAEITGSISSALKIGLDRIIALLNTQGYK